MSSPSFLSCIANVAESFNLAMNVVSKREYFFSFSGSTLRFCLFHTKTRPMSYEKHISVVSLLQRDGAQGK